MALSLEPKLNPALTETTYFAQCLKNHDIKATMIIKHLIRIVGQEVHACNTRWGKGQEPNFYHKTL